MLALPWLQGGGLHLALRYLVGTEGDPGTLKFASGGLKGGCSFSTTLLGLVYVCLSVCVYCMCVPVPHVYHSPADLHWERNSFTVQAPYLTLGI